MRVLLCFPQRDGQTGPAIKKAFENLGHEVIDIDAKLEPDISFGAACKFTPDLVFCSRTYQLTEQVEQIKLRFKNATVCMWNVDTRNSIHEWEYLFPLIKLCDYYFVVASNLLPDWQKINPNTFWLPQGLQNEVYRKPKEITDEDIKTFECDVSFAGSCAGYHGWRVPYLNAITNMGVKFRFYGDQGLPKVYNEDHNKMVACSKINLGLSGWHKNGKYVSVRDYKILGAGGCLLEFEQDGLFDFMPIKGLDFYNSPDQLVRKIEILLSFPAIREKIAEVGYKWVHGEATYTHRIKRALEIMGLK